MPVRDRWPAAVADTTRRGARRQRHDENSTGNGGKMTTRAYETHVDVTAKEAPRFREITRSGQVSPPMSVSYAS
ncbi:hypothetical protein Ais01nite_41910 [Asanoa ishikariensis]|nr:hypothetical protein Ais01nite_41910 [Asanoa ishikariensis]